MVSIKDMSLSKKLIGGFALVVILLGIVGFVGYNGITQINTKIDKILNDDMVMKNLVADMQTAALGNGDAINSYGLGQADAKNEIEKTKIDFERAKTSLLATNLDPQEKQMMTEIGQLYSSFEESGQKFDAAIDASKLQKNSDVEVAMTKFDEDRKALDKKLQDFEEVQNTQMAESKQVTAEIEHSALLMIISISIIAAIIGLGIGFYISRSITKPVDAMLQASNKIAAGDLTVQLVNDSRDEIGQLSTAIQTMADSLKGVLGKVQQSAINVSSTAQELSASSEEMKASTDQISSTTQDIATGVSSQASKMAEISRAMKEMSESVQQVATQLPESR